MELLARMLHKLGFRRVAGVLDGDHASELSSLQTAFPEYFFTAIPADDIRDKKAATSKKKTGLLDTELKVKPDLRSSAIKVFNRLNDYFK